MRYAVRSLLQNSTSSLLAVFSLAVGIGGNTLMFSIVDAVLMRPLPYPHSERLVFAWFVPPNEPDKKRAATIANYHTLREQTSIFDHLGTVGGVEDTATLEASLGETAEEVEGQRFSAAIPQALGATPLKGRWFTEAEENADAQSVIVISHRLWQRRFGGATDILGRTVRLDGEAATIIGVMPEGWMLFNYPAQFWAPYHVTAMGSERVLPVARLKAGINLRQAQNEMNRLATRLSDAFPATNKGWRIRWEPALDVYVGWVRQPLLIAQGVALFVLLIACANTAGLLLVRGTVRVREIGFAGRLGGWAMADFAAIAERMRFALGVCHSSRSCNCVCWLEALLL